MYHHRMPKNVISKSNNESTLPNEPYLSQRTFGLLQKNYKIKSYKESRRTSLTKHYANY